MVKISPSTWKFIFCINKLIRPGPEASEHPPSDASPPYLKVGVRLWWFVLHQFHSCLIFYLARSTKMLACDPICAPSVCSHHCEMNTSRESRNSAGLLRGHMNIRACRDTFGTIFNIMQVTWSWQLHENSKLTTVVCLYRTGPLQSQNADSRLADSNQLLGKHLKHYTFLGHISVKLSVGVTPFMTILCWNPSHSEGFPYFFLLLDLLN